MANKQKRKQQSWVEGDVSEVLIMRPRKRVIFAALTHPSGVSCEKAAAALTADLKYFSLLESLANKKKKSQGRDCITATLKLSL